MKLPIAMIGIIAHGHGDFRDTFYRLDICSNNSNHIVGSLAKLLRDLESLPKYSSHQLFVGGGISLLFQALLHGTNVCEGSILPPPKSLVLATPSLPVFNIQLDDACADNKNQYVFSFCSLFIHRGVFYKVYINFFIFGHTHNDIDSFFGRWS
jgi:hypothetical protein